MENTGDYFVMLNLQHGGITPMTYKETDELAVFETKEEAEASAKTVFLVIFSDTKFFAGAMVSSVWLVRYQFVSLFKPYR
jgi:hypothetical protein